MRKENNTTPNSFWWKQGFYDSPVEGGVEITAQYWQELLNGQSNGSVITENEEGYPVLAEPGPKTLEEWRTAKLHMIKEHDNSPAVNSFMIGQAELWFDKATRSSLSVTVEAEEMAGRSTTLFWTNAAIPVPIQLPISRAREILAALEVYAKDAFNVTQAHIAAISGLNSIEAVTAYDHTAGYPEKLSFEL